MRFLIAALLALNVSGNAAAGIIMSETVESSGSGFGGLDYSLVESGFGLVVYDISDTIRLFSVPTPEPGTVFRASDYSEFSRALDMLTKPYSFDIPGIAALLLLDDSDSNFSRAAGSYANLSSANRVALGDAQITDIVVTYLDSTFSRSDSGAVTDAGVSALIEIEGEWVNVPLPASTALLLLGGCLLVGFRYASASGFRA